jgi:hypothetical protein
MNITDWIGFTGVTILLLAFFLNLRGNISSGSAGYLALNFLGAGLACLASVLLNYWPFIILEGCWTIVSLVSVVNVFRRDEPVGENNLALLLKSLQPKLHAGEYVFCTSVGPVNIPIEQQIMSFREEEGITLVVEKNVADHYQLKYTYVASWISLTVYSSLEAVGLTAAFSKALSQAGISCNVVAAYHHDHIFVNQADGTRAQEILKKLSAKA